MNPGDLVSPKQGAGFSWWEGQAFLVIERDGEWLELIYPESNGKPLSANMNIFRHISEDQYEEG